jgi:hypothetical protein
MPFRATLSATIGILFVGSSLLLTPSAASASPNTAWTVEADSSSTVDSEPGDVTWG